MDEINKKLDTLSKELVQNYATKDDLNFLRNIVITSILVVVFLGIVFKLIGT